jgi:serine/threonine protein kinase
MDQDESLLDYGSPKAKAAEAPKPAAEPPKPAPAPAAKSDPTQLPSWMDQDESLLDYGSPKAKAGPPAEKPAAPSPAAGSPSKAFELPKDKRDETVPTGERSIGMVPGGGETMLDMGTTPRTSSKPADPAAPAPAGTSSSKTFALPKDKPADAGPTVDRSIGPIPEGGGTTMLDMGSAGRKPGEPASPVDTGATIVPGGGGGETMLDMGVTPPKRDVQGMTTSILGGKKALPGGIPKPPPELPKLPDSASSSSSSPAYDVTTKQGNTKTEGTFMMTPPTGSSSSTVDRTQIQQTTPKTGAGGSSAAIANAKALPPEVAQAAKDTNRVFGKYILMSELGRGGAGVVYKAWDTLILQYVALKFIRNQDEAESDSTSGSSQIEEFQREARMSVRLRHPNIVRIYELGCMSNRYYLSMEYIEGGTLLALIHGGKERNIKTRFNSDPLKFLKIMQSIALAVDYAHNTKPPIIHRDLKPHNVLVDTKGNPYVVDFGLAKEVEQGDGATLTGVVKGTPTYMAPEQAEGRNRDVDPRTDVYSLGAIMYEMLTGRPPYTGESVPEILRKIATELPERPNDVITKNALAATGDTTSKLNKSKSKGLLVPKPLETICLKALEKGKPDRYQSAKELAEDIDRYLKDEDILAQEPGLYRRIRRRIRQHPITSAAVAAVLLAGLSVGVVLKTVDKGDQGKKLVESIVQRGDQALQKQDWITLRGAADDLSRQEKTHPKIALFEKALKDHRDLVEKTEDEWRKELDRLRGEPLAKVLPGLREKFNRCPELKPRFRESLTGELNSLKGKMLDKGRELVGNGPRGTWVEEVVKTPARDLKELADTLIGMAKDPDFKYEVEGLVSEIRDGLAQVIAYQGTWTLQVNVAPYAEVTLSSADKELKTEFTPVGVQDLEVVGSSYVVELCWPSRENPKVKVKQEIKDLHHNQIVMIRGDMAKDTLKQERAERAK